VRAKLGIAVSAFTALRLGKQILEQSRLVLGARPESLVRQSSPRTAK
jgi:hypothetical protein